MGSFRQFLKAAGEQPLGVPSPNSIESYRLFLTMSRWVPTTVIRVECYLDPEWDEERGWTPRSKFRYPLAIHRANSPADLMHSETQTDEIRYTEWQTLLILLEKANFWTLSELGGHSGMDGVIYTLEGFQNGRFHSVTRWCPEIETDGEQFALPCIYLRDLGELAEYRNEMHNN